MSEKEPYRIVSVPLGVSLPAGVVSKGYSEPLDDIEHAQVEIDFTAETLTTGSLLTN